MPTDIHPPEQHDKRHRAVSSCGVLNLARYFPDRYAIGSSDPDHPLTDPLADLQTALADRYAIERELGAGGMATVYLATDLRHQRPVALKLLRPELVTSDAHERFLREITTTANLRHPHILPLFDSGRVAGLLFYVMPYVEGESLRDRLLREGRLPPAEALRIADEVADALAYAHTRQVIHRDIKPENILLENGHAVVADFGIAHAITATGDEKLTMAGMAIGTPQYMSPEQWSGEAVDARSDLYALACMTYEMLAGAPPFSGPTPAAIMTGHVVHPPPPIRTSCPEVPAPVAAALERALAKAPDDRFPSLQAWREALAGAGGTALVQAADRGFRKPPPVPATPLLGRERVLTEAEAGIASGARLFSITGYGGTGKTRFAIELFRRLEPRYPGGAAFVSLASVTAADEVLPTVATTLELAEAEGRSALEALVAVIGETPVLLVLDNLEQVLGSAGDIAALVGRCPGLQVIATSRAPLKVGAESEFPLPPLELPAEEAQAPDAIEGYPSVALFVQRAAKVKPGFLLSDGNARAVAAICRRLDGLPLALELAAARIRILDPDALLQRLDQALDLLTSGDRDLPLRQRTLRATISWSYSILDAGEQRLLRSLSVFHEGWTLEALEGVCYDPEDRPRALDELDSLVEKGLVRVVTTAAGTRYSLLETIRAFAAEQVHAAGETEALRDAHARYFLELAVGIDAGIKGTDQVASMRSARSDHANLAVALQWLTSRARMGAAGELEDALLMAGSLNWYWHMAGHHLSGRTALDALMPLAAGKPPSRGGALVSMASAMISSVTGDMERTVSDGAAARDAGLALGDQALAAEGCIYIGYGNLGLGRIEPARVALDEAIARARGVNDFLHGVALTFLGVLQFSSGDLEAGIGTISTARAIQERIGDCEGGGVAQSFLGQMLFARGDQQRALAVYREALALLGRVGDKPEIARVHCELGWRALAAGEPSVARQAFQRAVAVYEEVGSPRGTGLALLGLAAVEAAAGRAERALQIAAAADVLSEKAGVVVDHPLDPEFRDRIAELKASVPRAALEELLATGSTLSPAEVLTLVREQAA